MTKTHCDHCHKPLAAPVKLPGAPKVFHLACSMAATAASRAHVNKK